MTSSNASNAPAPDYTLIFDGGSKGNPGPAYGSYLIRTRDGREALQRVDFGIGTNNEAEYNALIAGLQDLLARIEHAGLSANSFIVEVRGDSQLVLNQVAGRWKVKQPHLAPLVNRARTLLQQFKHYHLLYHHRSENVRLLGH